MTPRKFQVWKKFTGESRVRAQAWKQLGTIISRSCTQIDFESRYFFHFATRSIEIYPRKLRNYLRKLFWDTITICATYNLVPLSTKSDRFENSLFCLCESSDEIHLIFEKKLDCAWIWPERKNRTQLQVEDTVRLKERIRNSDNLRLRDSQTLKLAGSLIQDREINIQFCKSRCVWS